jgi:hypothetical protein
MRTVKWNPFLSGVTTVLGTMLLCGAGMARADVSSTNAAAILVFPKVVVNTSAVDYDTQTDTLIQVTNTSASPVNVRCFYVDGNGHCSTSPSTVCSVSGDPASSPCTASGGFCVANCTETDFAFRLTAHQPIVWAASAGLPRLPLNDAPGLDGQFNSGSVPPVPENPLLGELKCVEVGDDELPVAANDLKGEATIETITAPTDEVPSVDSRAYNAIGIQAIAGANNNDNTLVIGGSAAEYNACPNVLVLNHFFDGAVEPSAAQSTVTTDLTLVSCSEDLNLQYWPTTTVQFLVFNEFEQRFSTSRSQTCVTELPLSDIDTRPGPSGDAQSIFNVAVEGTLTGQTTVRGVDDGSASHGNGVLAVTEEFHSGEGTHSAALVAHQRATRTDADIVQLPLAGVPGQ